MRVVRCISINVFLIVSAFLLFHRLWQKWKFSLLWLLDSLQETEPEGFRANTSLLTITGGVPAYKHQNGALLVSRWRGILQQIHLSLKKMWSTEHAEQSNGLYHSSSLLQKYVFHIEVRERLSWHVCKHVDGNHAHCLKDEWKILESLCLGLDIGDQAKLAFCVVSATVTFPLENIGARSVVPKSNGVCSISNPSTGDLSP